MRNLKNFFINSSYDINLSYASSNFKNLDKVFQLSGYPHIYLQSIFSEICSTFDEDNPTYQIHNCLDNSPQGIIFPEFSTGIICYDFYDINCHNFIAVSEDINAKQVKFNLDLAKETFSKSQIVHQDISKIFSDNMDFSKLPEIIDNISKKYIPNNCLKEKGQVLHRYISAKTLDGDIDYFWENIEEFGTRIFLTGKVGTGKSTFINTIANIAEKNSFDIVKYYNGENPRSLDMLLIPSLDFAIFDAGDKLPNRNEDILIDLYQICKKCDVEEIFAKQIANLQREYKALNNCAMEYLEETQIAIRNYDLSLPEIDITALNKICHDILSSI